MNRRDKARLKTALNDDLTIINEAGELFFNLHQASNTTHQLTAKEFASIFNAVTTLGNTMTEYAFKCLNLSMYQDNYKTLAGGSLRKPELINVRFAEKDKQVLSDIDDLAKEFIKRAKQVYGDDSHYYLTYSDLIALGYSLVELSYKFDAITW